MLKFFSVFQLIKIIAWLAVLGLIGLSVYVVVINVISFQSSPERVVKRFAELIENPTQTVTEEEKKVLAEITQNDFLTTWGNENNIKTLRNLAQKNPVNIGQIDYVGATKKYATANLTFTNNFKNPNSKVAKLYLEQYGNWFTGIKWRIYQIDMPQEDSVIDAIVNPADSILKQVQDSAKQLEGAAKSTTNQLQNTLNGK
jgi:hypothetical protein